MKSSYFAVMALLGCVSAVKLQDETIYDPEHYAGLYTNILLDVDAFKHNQHRRRDSHHHGNKKHSRDMYDGDSNTVSQYDGDAIMQPTGNKERQDWFDEAETHKNQKIYDSFV